ncbi:hypothetical protein ILUMI_18768 [Ignelater luminosus]|uniref:CCHC-type domain-containing protein n=1 Tax=Ignelater luminosus TaxID=2038154 RepID=A0A8K0CHK5_IGNLU|nr:hypothetical protein ILUMI_18768 [Ignelater luminosus]
MNESINAEDILSEKINNLSKIILKQIPEKSDSIKVEARKTCRDATEKIRNHAIEMLGIIRFLKLENQRLHKEKQVPTQIEKQEEKHLILKENNSKSYANVLSKKPQTTFGIKITGKNTENTNQIEKILKTNIDPSKINISIASLKKLKSGIIVECNNKNDAEKLKTAVEASKELQGTTLNKGNPRIILTNVDKELDKERFMQVLIQNNKNLIEACGGIIEFHKQVKEKFRIGGKEKDRFVSIVLEVSGTARREFLRGRINLEWQSLFAKDFISIMQCYKCYRFGHKSHACKEKIQICGKCGNQGHDYKNCKESFTKCIACMRMNDNKKGSKSNINHDARDKNCPTLNKIKEKISKSIDYGQ